MSCEGKPNRRVHQELEAQDVINFGVGRVSRPFDSNTVVSCPTPPDSGQGS